MPKSHIRQSIYDTKIKKLIRTTPCWTVFSQAVGKDLPDRIHVSDPFILPNSYHMTRAAARRDAADRNRYLCTTTLQAICPIVYRVGRCSVLVKVWSIK